jgi:hypothetical protein
LTRPFLVPLLLAGLLATSCGRDAVELGFKPGAASDGAVPFDSGFPPDRDGGVSPIRDGGFGPIRDGGFGPIRDSGFPPIRDGGFGPIRDGGFPPIRDSGFPPGRDGGFPPIRDSGFPPGRDAGPPRDGGFPPTPDGGVCQHSDCAPLDGPCVVGRCDFATNMCRRVPRPNGTMCEDGNPCTTGDFCLRGTCRSGGPLVCPPPPGQCVESICDASAGGCVAVAAPDGTSCNDSQMCTVNDQCVGGMCQGISSAPMGDTCPGQFLLSPVGTQTEVGSNVCATDTAVGSCGFSGGHDAIYRMNLTDPRRIRMETVPVSIGGFDTVVYARSTCNQSASELVCDDNSGTGPLSSFDRQFEPGEVFFFVDGRTASAQGAYAVEFEVDPQNRCAGATQFTVPPLNTTVRFDGSTNGATNDFGAPCASGQGSADNVYTFTLAQEARVRFETEPVSMNQYDTAIALHAAPCTEGMPMTIACDDDDGMGTLSRIEATLPPGTYFLTVDGWAAGNSGRYRLAVTRLANLTSVVFPDALDARLTQVGTTYSRDGDFVEGIRTIPATSITQAEVDLQITNNLTCNQHPTLVFINGVQVGTFAVGPGQTTVNQTFSFPAITGPAYALRLETAADVPMGCGSIDYPNGVSFFRLGN